MTEATTEIVAIVAEVVPDGGTALARRVGAPALAPARELHVALAQRLETDAAYAPVWQAFLTQPQSLLPALEGVLRTLLATDAALARRLERLLDAYHQATPGNAAVNTGGGAYIGGNVHTGGGDFTGRDHIKVTGNQNVVGDHNVVHYEAVAAARAFQALYQAVDRRASLAPADKDDIKAELADLQAALATGARADERAISRRLRNIQRMAPDILEVVLGMFANPLAGLGIVAVKIAAKMKAEAEKET